MSNSSLPLKSLGKDSSLTEWSRKKKVRVYYDIWVLSVYKVGSSLSKGGIFFCVGSHGGCFEPSVFFSFCFAL